MAKYIKITTVSGIITFALFNKDLYDRLNIQNESISSVRKSKIESVEITPEEINDQSGYDENAGIELNPVTAKLSHDNLEKDSKILDLEKQLADLKANQTESKNKNNGKI